MKFSFSLDKQFKFIILANLLYFTTASLAEAKTKSVLKNDSDQASKKLPLKLPPKKVHDELDNSSKASIIKKQKTNRTVASSTIAPPLVYLKQRLRKNGFPKPFIQALLKNYEDTKRDQVVKLNVMGFLMSPDYSGHISPDSVQRCRIFLTENKKVFVQAEKKFGVKKEIIASLLWVESRLGENHGSFHVASVYLSLLQAEHPQLTQVLLEDLVVRAPSPTKAMIKKTKERAKIKGRWAVGELWSLYKMNKKDPTIVSQLKGSYSGAFGYSQFLPSSYVSWAKSFNPKKPADLYSPQDAIMSVANYLHKNGYKKNKPKSYKKALFHYNRSDDYGEIILKLSEKL